MNGIFLNILNMSITASYVIAAILLIRLLLKKAPKKYSYLLWSVVLFRLVCPVSFSSVFSIFQTGPFDMTAAQKDTLAVLRYVPADIGYARTPKLTTGIPTMNSFINDGLPPAVPYSIINPMQIWIRLGTILWCCGVALFIIISIVNFIRLKYRMATAVRLTGNVFESDLIRSPFILGLANPRIYIPFGLNSQELTYILKHEYYHLKRKDHLLKAFSYYVMILYWFNPFVWLAFVSMSKDMEMSCDEKVLTETGTGIIPEYSTSLLSFAANRRFPAANPLAFGETGIRERIHNVLRFQKPKKWVVLPAAIICMITVAACAANPKESSVRTEKTSDLYGNYVFEKQVYMNPLSSFLALDGFKEYYTLTEDSFIITDGNGGRQKTPATYEQSPVDEEEFKNSFLIDGIGTPDLSRYKTLTKYRIIDPEGRSEWNIYLLDKEFWLVRMHQDSVNMVKNNYIWSIYKIDRYDGMLPLNQSILSGTEDGVPYFLSLLKDFKPESANDICYNITPDYIKENSEYQIFKFNSSCASFLMYEDKIYPLGDWFGGFGLTSMALGDINNDKKLELYFTYSFGSGLHRSHLSYFDPAVRQTVPFEYAYFNGDLRISYNEDGGLSLYTAEISDIEDFVNFKIEGKEFISDVVIKNGKIAINTD